MDGPRAPRTDEFESMMAVVNLVFRARNDQPPTMGDEFPLLFSPENREHLRVTVDDGRVVCHVGSIYQTMLIGESRLPTASIGSVCTHPDYRGRGLASQALEDLMAAMARDGIALMPVSGNRGLYKRHACVTGGRRRDFDLTVDQLADVGAPAVAVRRRTPDDFETVRALYEAEPLRYEREPRNFLTLLESFERNGSTTVVFTDEVGRALAYAIIRHAGPMAWAGKGVGRVVEWAGVAESVVGGLASAARLIGVERIQIGAVRGREEVADLLASAGFEGKEGPLGGTFRVIDPGVLVTALAPWWRDRLGGEMPAVTTPDGGAVRLGLGGAAITAPDLGAFTRLIFSGDAPEGAGAAFDRLRPALPVPLPAPGLNYA